MCWCGYQPVSAGSGGYRYLLSAKTAMDMIHTIRGCVPAVIRVFPVSAATLIAAATHQHVRVATYTLVSAAATLYGQAEVEGCGPRCVR